jgi:hypothetical protein
MATLVEPMLEPFDLTSIIFTSDIEEKIHGAYLDSFHDDLHEFFGQFADLPLAAVRAPACRRNACRWWQASLGHPVVEK